MVKALSNVIASFDNIKPVTKEVAVWKPGWVLNQLHHPQGIAISNDKYYISHNGVKEGYIYVFQRGDAKGDELVSERKIIGGDGYNHPGTIQAADNLLLAALQKQIGGSYTGTQVTLHNLDDWKTGPCVLLKDDNLSGKGMAGIVCVEDNGQKKKYVAISEHNTYEIKIGNGGMFHSTSEKDALSWPELDRLGVDEQSVNLVVDKNGTIYAITSGVHRKNHDNMLLLYQMEVQNQDSSGTITKASMKHIKSRKIDLCNGWLTCSAGTGIEIKGESIIVYVTSKPATSSRRITIGISEA